MAKFDRFTKALALGNFRQAYKVLVGDEEDATSCVAHNCRNGQCPLHGSCICLAGLCVRT